MVEFIDPRKTPFVRPKSRGELPHLYKPGGFYFVTFRLADAVVLRAPRPGAPRNASTRVRPAPPPTMAVPAPDPDPDPEEIAAAYDPPLTLGSCALRRPEIASLVQNALLHFHDLRYSLVAWCVMPNHVHGVFSPLGGYTPSDVLQSWKGFTARRANEILGIRGPFWERESFDHLIRSARSLERFVRYIDLNPVEAGLCESPELWPYSSAGVGFSPVA